MNCHALRLDRAGRLMTDHAMVWVRYLNAPVEQVWPLVSTKQGLARWWIVLPRTFDLRIGGAFNHHWDNTITSFEPFRYIDFDEPAGSYRGTGGMRIELTSTGSQETTFMFLGTWGADVRPSAEAEASDAQQDLVSQPAGPGTPWPSVAAGWHGMVDQLEQQFRDDAPSHSVEDLAEFYVDYLKDQFRLLGMVQRSTEGKA
ncbi:MAG: SRPBCC domain-containing protein [Pseudomonadota bacterium]